MSIILDKTIAVGLIVVIIFTALAQGVVEPWSVLLFELTVTSLLLLWAIRVFVVRKLIITVPHLAWPLAGLIVIGMVQSVIWTDGAGRPQSLSFDVEATRSAVMILCCLLGCCLIAANFLVSDQRLRMLAKFLPIYGFGLAFIALVQHFGAGDTAYWPRAVRADGSFGPFINRDHFAAYIELLIAVPIALIVTRYVRGEKTLLYGGAAAIMGIAAIFSLSRGGVISLLAEMLLIVTIGLRRSQNTPHKHRSRTHGRTGRRTIEALTVTLIIAAIVAGVAWLGAEPVIDRIASGNLTNPSLNADVHTFHSVRGAIWKDTWRLIRENPVAGVGLGAFELAYPIYAWDKGGEGIVAQAHNDYLQVLADAGIFGGALALWFVVIVMRTIVRSAGLHDPLSAGLALGGGAGVFGLLVHSLFDFGLQLPSHAVLFLSLSTVVSHLAAMAEERLPRNAASANVIPDLVSEVPS